MRINNYIYTAKTALLRRSDKLTSNSIVRSINVLPKDTISFGMSKPPEYSYLERMKILKEKTGAGTNTGYLPEFHKTCKSFSDKQFEQLSELLDIGIDYDISQPLVEESFKTQRSFDSFKKLVQSGFDVFKSIYISTDDYGGEEKYDDDTISKIIELKNSGAEDDDAESFALKATIEQVERYKKLSGEDIPKDIVYNAAMLSEEDSENFEQKMKDGYSPKDAYTLVSLKDNKTFQILLESGVTVKDAALMKNATNPVRAAFWYNKGASVICARHISDCSEEEYERFLNLCNISNNYLLNIQSATSPNYEKITGYLSDGLPLGGAKDLTDIEADGLSFLYNIDENTISLIKKGVDVKLSSSVAQNKELFENVTQKLQKGMNPDYIRDIQYIMQFGTGDLSLIDYESKLKLNAHVSSLKAMPDINLYFDKTELSLINRLSKLLTDELSHIITPTEVSENSAKNMMKNFFANNDKNVEGILKNTDFSKFGKNGIPLLYPRESFLNDLSELIKNIDKETEAKTFKKFGITPVREYGKIKGYDGIINLSEKNIQSEEEAKLYKICHKYIYENKVITGNRKLDNTIGALIDGMPEFINIIGKKTDISGVPLDIQALCVLSESLKNKNYGKLSDSEKTILKFSALLHNTAKSESEENKDYTSKSALYAKNIINKYKFPYNIKLRIYETVKNSDGIEKYLRKRNTAQKTAVMFRIPGDYDIAKIINESKRKTQTDYHSKYDEQTVKDKLAHIEKYIDKIHSTGQIILTGRIINDRLIPRINHKGREYKVIDFTKIKDNEDLSKFGFAPGTTKESARFLIHMTENSDALETAEILSDMANESMLCTSFVSPKNSPTYLNRPFGVVLESDNANISDATDHNQGSGGRKGLKQFEDAITYNKIPPQNRTFLSDTATRELGLSRAEYGELFKQISSFTHFSQIKSDYIFSVGQKTISGKELIKAVKKADDLLIRQSNSEKRHNVRGIHNEVNLYDFKISAFVAKKDSLDEIPEKYLNYAESKNLPIFLFGS